MSIQFGRYWRLLATYLKPQSVRMVLLTILLLGSIGLQLVNPLIVSYFLDTALAGGALQLLLIAAGAFISITIVQRVIAFFSLYMAENVGWTATNELRADLTMHCLQLDMSFHKKHTPGELIERIDADVTTLANFFSQFTVKVLGNVLLIVGVLLFMFRADWRAGLVLTVYSLLTLLALHLLQNVGVKRWKTEREANADFYGFVEEHVTGTEDIRAAGAEPYVLRRLYILMRRLLETQRTARLVSNITFFSTRFLYVIGYATGLAMGAYLYTQGLASIGTAYLIVFYIGMLSEPLENIREEVEDLQKAGASIERVEELFGTSSEIKEAAQQSLPAGKAAVDFEQVTFSYEQQEPVLHNISFELQPGRVLGLLGHTGSGKTTLTRLLFRLYDPDSGVIRLNGVDIRAVSLEDLRSHVGMVTQDVQLFQASIRDNLTFFNSEISDEKIESVLQRVGLWNWVQSLPDGLATQLGAGGQGLSAGEAQLLALTRVFLRNPGLVLLDEASSRLDPATEHLLEQAVDHLLEDRSGIVIAHRLQTVLRADEIMILDQGRIIEYGPRETLASDPNSHFYRLLQTGLEEVLA